MSLKVAVIYGSRTCEHDVSIVSALQAMDNLDKNEYEIVPVYIARDGQWYTGRLLRNITFYSAFQARTGDARRARDERGWQAYADAGNVHRAARLQGHG